MPDPRIRSFERQAPADSEARARLLRAQLQSAEVSERDLRLLAYREDPAAISALEGLPDLDRWSRLSGFTRKWYARPLSAEDGSTELELAACEARLEISLPEALREWFGLVGQRLAECCLNFPVPLRHLEQRGDLLPIAWHAQGVCAFGIRSQSLQEPDPLIVQDFLDGKRPKAMAPLTEFLVWLVLHETTLNVATREEAQPQLGPLGELRSEVRGDWINDKAKRSYTELPLATSKAGFKLYGDADTVLADEHGITRTPQAWSLLESRI